MTDKKLSLSDWADIASILSAVAVVVSLVFVAMQIRDNTSALQSQNERDLVRSLQQLELNRVTDESLAQLLMRARQGADLSPVDRYRVDSLVYLYLNTWEEALHDYTHGLMEPEIWAALDRWMTDKARQPYFRDIIATASKGGTYSTLFEAHLRDSVLPKVEGAAP